jgi:hypothetical protein
MFARSARRLRQRLHSPLIEETQIKATPSPSYAAKKAALEDDQVLLSLELMEEAVLAEPDNWTHRVQVGEVIWDKSERGLALAYSVENGEIVFLTFVDLFIA